MLIVDEQSAVAAVELWRRPPIAQLFRLASFVGHVAQVRSYGAHRLLVLEEHANDGRGLAVWVSSVALEAERSRPWIGLLSAAPELGLVVCFQGRFADHAHAERLTADVHFAENIWLRPPHR